VAKPVVVIFHEGPTEEEKEKKAVRFASHLIFPGLDNFIDFINFITSSSLSSLKSSEIYHF
jgi:hypothetical protein